MGDLSGTSNSPQAFLRSDKLCWSRCWQRTPQMRNTCQKSRARLIWHHLPTWLISIFLLTLHAENVTETSFTCYKTNNSKWETEKKKILRLFVINLAQCNYAFLRVPERHRLETIQGSFFSPFLPQKYLGFCAVERGGGAGRCPNMWISAVCLAPSPPAGALCCFEVKVSQSYKVFAIESDHKTACFKEESGIKRWIPPP